MGPESPSFPKYRALETSHCSPSKVASQDVSGLQRPGLSVHEYPSGFRGEFPAMPLAQASDPEPRGVCPPRHDEIEPGLPSPTNLGTPPKAPPHRPAADHPRCAPPHRGLPLTWALEPALMPFAPLRDLDAEHAPRR